MAAPPDVLRVDEKNLREHSVFNVCGVVMTTNHKTDGIYLPADDRRHYVAWSEKTKDDFTPAYWDELWKWYDRERLRSRRRLPGRARPFGFQSESAAEKTAAFWAIVDANRAPEDAELADVLDKLERPDAVTLDMLVKEADRRIFASGCATVKTGASSPTGSNSAAMSRCATTRPSTGCSRSTSPAGRLREGRPLHSRPPGSRAQADQPLNPLMRSARVWRLNFTEVWSA